MEIKWVLIGILAVCVVILVVYIIRRNFKDEKNFVKYLNETDEVKHKHEDETGEDV